MITLFIGQSSAKKLSVKYLINLFLSTWTNLALLYRSSDYPTNSLQWIYTPVIILVPQDIHNVEGIIS